jgi:hypothetical protein
VRAQHVREMDIPGPVVLALMKKFPDAQKVRWEIEKGNFEANWGGRSREDSAATFTPSGAFLELVEAISIHQLPANIAPYVAKKYSGARIREAGKVTDAFGKHFYEAEIKGKDLIFDEQGHFVKED